MKNNYTFFLLSVLLWLPGNSISICQTVYENYWIPNNNVWATARSGNTVYIGGAFTRISPSTGCGTTIDLSTGNPNFSFAKVNNSVMTSIPDGSGGWYIGGYFTRVGDVPRNKLAHIYADGSLDPDWNPSVTGGDPTVRSIAILGSTVFVGGNFHAIDGYSRNNLAAIDAGSGEVIENWVCNTNGHVFTLAVASGVLYAGGSFLSIGGTSRNFIAAINAGSGIIDPNWIPNANDWVLKIVPAGNLVYVGGHFSHIGSQTPQPTRNLLAALQISDARATNWDPNVTPDGGAFVYSIFVSEETVYIGGGFNFVDGQTRKSVAEIYINICELTTWAPTVSGYFQTVFSVSVTDAIVYLGGEFTSVNREPRFCLAAIEERTGDLTDWNPHPDEAVLTFSVSGTDIYTGGRFFGVGGVQRNHLAAFDLTTGMLLDWNPNVEGEVQNPAGYSLEWVKKFNYQYGEFFDPLDRDSMYCDAGELTEPYIFSIAIAGDKVLVGGQFTTVGGMTRNNIAAINATTGTVIEEWDPNSNGPIQAISVLNSIAYIGGNYTSIGNLNRDRIAALDLETGDVIVDWSANANSVVQAIEVSDSRVYAGGEFTSIGGENRNYIAALDVETGEVIDDWHPNASSVVYSLELDGSILYVGGMFSIISNETRNYIAAIDAESGRVIDWDPNITGGRFVHAIDVYGSTVYAAGSFTMVGQEERISLAALNKETGLATDWDPRPMYPNSPSPIGEVFAISVSSGGAIVYAGGFFSEIKDKVQAHFAALTGDGITVVTNSLIKGWQTLSVPVVVDDFTKTSVWPTADPNSYAYSFCGNGGYVPEDTLKNGVGYYVKFNSPQNKTYIGEIITECSIPVCAGWNIVGSISDQIPVSTNICLFPGPNSFTSPFYIYENGYIQKDSIVPGKGHWIKVAMDGSILFNRDPIQCDSPERIVEENMDHFKVTDAQGKTQNLYVANLNLNPSLGEIDLSMPPPFPEAEFDARFGEGEYIKTVSPDSGTVELVINIETEYYPLTVSWELNPENGIEYSLITAGLGKEATHSNLNSSGSTTMIKSSDGKFRINALASKQIDKISLPKEYSLQQNYPNPFNPTTKINYSVKEAGLVKLKVYDILGKEIANLVNENKEEGNYSVSFYASQLPSGVYIYTLQVNGFSASQKMLLLK